METNTNTTTAATTSAPSSSAVSRTVLLLLRVLTFVFLLIAFIVIVLTKETLDGESELKFKDIHAYRWAYDYYLIMNKIIVVAYII